MTDSKQQPDYAGDVSPELAWQMMQQGQAVIVDVRSDAERVWVGRVPGAIAVALKQWPGMEINEHFDARLQQLVPPGTTRLLMLCRSGARSREAARHATALGYQASNILGGFEGDLNEQSHRGERNGWRHAGLPWEQS